MEDKVRIVLAVLRGEVNLACAVTVRTTTSDAIAVFEAALAEVEALLGVSWVEDLTDPATGQIATLRLVTDNGAVIHVGALRGLGRLQASHLPHPRPPPSAVDQRRRRALLRSHQIRTPLPARHRQRPRTRRPDRLLPHDLQHNPTPRSHRHDPTPPALPTNPDHPTPRPRKCLRFLTRDITDKVEALYDQPHQLPASDEGNEMRKLRAEMHRRMLGNGYCARPVEMDCHFESICESCNFFVTTIEFKPTLRRQRDDAADKGQIRRQKIFDSLLDRLDEQAS